MLKQLLRIMAPLALLVTAFATGDAAARPSAAGSVAETLAVQPARVLDTRIGLGARGGLLAPGTPMQLDLRSQAPADATAVALNVVAVDATSPGWLRAWPCSEAEPDTSALNFTAGRAVANLVIIKLGAGKICFDTYAPANLVADVTGWFTGANDLVATNPGRVLDTRTAGSSPLAAGVERKLHLAGRAGIGDNASLAAVNLTVDQPSQPGWVVAYPCGKPSSSSSVNFSAGEIVATSTIVALSAGDVCLRSSVPVQLIVDSYGWSAGGSLLVQSPQRLLDTRSPSWTAGKVKNGSTVRLAVSGLAGVPSNAVMALLNITVTGTDGDGFVTVWPCDQPQPATSTLNTWPGALRSNMAMVPLSAVEGTACIELFTSNATPIDLVVDAIGWKTGGVNRPTPPTTVVIPSPVAPPTNPVGTAPSAHFATLPVGAQLPSDAECSARVRPAPETRSTNDVANHTTWHTVADYPRADGNFTGTTDEIIQWAACKWGLDEDILRAQVAQESWWHQSTRGDYSYDPSGSTCAPGNPPDSSGNCPASVGLIQVRTPYNRSAIDGAVVSSAFNLEIGLFGWRNCYEGKYTWLNTLERGRDYSAGDVWGCLGMWFSGRWYTPGAYSYIGKVQAKLAARVWTTPEFLSEQ